MPHDQNAALKPAGFVGCCTVGPANPQAAYNAGPLVRESGTVGQREPVQYPVQVGGVTPQKLTTMP